MIIKGVFFQIYSNSFHGMRFLIALIFILIGIKSGFSQSNVRDSLNQVLNQKLPDSTRINVLISLAQEYQYENFSKALEISNEAIALAEEKNLTRQKARAYHLNSILLSASGDFNSALSASIKALQFILVENDLNTTPNYYNAIGNTYHELGDYDDAYSYFTQAYRKAKEVGDTLTLAITLHNIGRIFKELGYFKHALNFLNISRDLSLKIHDHEGMAYYFMERGDIYIREHTYDSALVFFGKARTEAGRLEVMEIIPLIFNYLAAVYEEKNNFEKAFVYYDSAESYHKRTSNQVGIGEVFLGRGQIFLKQENYNEAYKFFEKSLAISRELNAKILEGKCQHFLSILWEQKGEYQKSLEAFKSYQLIKDSLFNSKVEGKLFTENLQFGMDAKDQEIVMLRELENSRIDEIKRQEFLRNILVVVMALTVILLISTYRSGQRRKQINMLLIRHQEDTEQKAEELEKLNQVKDKFFSIISHDLRSPVNALAGILDLMTKEGITPEEFSSLTNELRNRFNHTRILINNLLDWTLLQMDKLNLQPRSIELKKLADENLELMENLKTKKVEFINKIPEQSIVFADYNTVSLVLRNLLTNSLKFTHEGGVIQIEAEEQETEWNVCVRDNGIGIEEEIVKFLFDKTNPYSTRGTANERGTGLGLILCKEFVEKNGGKIWVDSVKNEGSSFWFSLPKSKK